MPTVERRKGERVGILSEEEATQLRGQLSNPDYHYLWDGKVYMQHRPKNAEDGPDYPNFVGRIRFSRVVAEGICRRYPWLKMVPCAN